MFEEIDGYRLQDACANPPLDVLAPMLLQDNAGDPRPMKTERQQESCRARSNDGYLGLQGALLKQDILSKPYEAELAQSMDRADENMDKTFGPIFSFGQE